jgi:proline iminopeptidase
MPSPIPPPRASGFTTSTPVPLYWAAYGPVGAPGILVLHGGPGAHHDYMLPQMLELASDYELIFYDQRGGGRSTTPSRAPITWRTHVGDLALVVRELGLTPLSLIGYSWGGLLALLYAIITSGTRGSDASAGAPAPSRMVLIDPAPVTGEFRAQFEQEFARRQQSDEVRRMREELAASGLRERDYDAYRQRLFELSVAGYFADPAQARSLTPFRVTGRVQQSVWESLNGFDLTHELGAVRAPTLVVHGDEDPIPLASSEATVRALPHARLVTLPHSGHVPYVEAADALFDAVRMFLAETDRLVQSGV